MKGGITPMNKRQTLKGFTIIEVVLVLAIAGLIFLMVFIALPALQRGQRDTQRRDDVAQISSQMTSYQTNNGGNLPASTAFGSFLTTYAKDLKDPTSGSAYTAGSTTATTRPTAGQVQYIRSASCSGENITTITPTNTRAGALRIMLENGGYFCQSVNKP